MRTIAMVGVVGVVAAGLLAASGCTPPCARTDGQGCGVPPPCQALGVRGCWTFDEGSGETAKNAVGPNNGRIVGGLKWTDGKTGKAVAFDGKGHVLIESAAYLNSPQYTFAAWVKLKDTSDYQYIVWRGGPKFPEDKECRNLDIWVQTDGTLNGLLDYEKGGDRLHVMGTKKVDDNEWHLVVCVNDGKTVRFYVDGRKDAEGALAGPPAKSDFPLWIGARPADVAATGIIDEVRFFARALTPEEVAGLK